MSFFIVEDDEGKALNANYHFDNTMIDAILYDEPIEPKLDSRTYGGHVVELIEAQAKIVVSEEEAKMLEQAKDDYCAASVISAYSTEHIGAMGQDRLMRAYVIGWTVEKPKRYLIKVPHTDDSYFYKIDDEYCNAGDSYHLEGMTDNKWFTAAEIKHYGLQDCEKVEVTE